MAEFIETVFAKTSPKRLFSVIENERFRLVFTITGYLNSGTVVALPIHRKQGDYKRHIFFSQIF
jgi:hypothetical protein